MTGEPVYIIAEIGINHDGSLPVALEMMRQAKAAGADAVKFQKRTVDAVYTAEELAQPRESPWGVTNGDLKRRLEFAQADYEAIADLADDLNLHWSASVWDEDSVEFLMPFELPWLKLPSAKLTDLALRQSLVETEMPIILSTGMSTEDQIHEAIDHFQDNELTVLHCTSTYPCPDDELNLNYITELIAQEEFGAIRYTTGFSSHSVSPWPCLMAVCCGAKVIEAHVTLSRAHKHRLSSGEMWQGTDHAASLEFEAFAKMVEEIRTFEKAAGDGVKRVYASEVPIRKKLRR